MADGRSLLIVGAFPRSAALERYVSGDLALRLAARGWAVKITSQAASRLRRLADVLTDTLRYRCEFSVACVDVFSGPAFVWAEVACTLMRALGKPYVLTLHGGNLPEFSRKHPKRVMRLFRSACVVTCPSPYLARRMRQFRPDLVVLPNGLELSDYQFRERRPPLTKLIWVRAFHRIYNPTMAVEVVAHLKDRHPLTLKMIGPDKGDGSLQRARSAATTLGVSNIVDLVSGIPKSAVPEALAGADIFLNSTTCDNMPVSVLEAMASGLPVVSTDAGGLPDLIDNERTGLLVGSNDVAGMAAGISRLLENPQFAGNLARAARQSIRQYDWPVVLDSWDSLLSRLLEAQPMAGGNVSHLNLDGTN